LRRRLSSILGILVITSSLFVGTSMVPASAALCSGQGGMYLNKNIGLPILGSVSNVGFVFVFNCAVNNGSPASATATGSIASASCGRSTGGIGTVFGKPFVFQSVGTLFIVQSSGGSGVKGVFNAVPDPRVANNSCASGTAHVFVVTAAFKGPW
jgi:hypothetical protein